MFHSILICIPISFVKISNFFLFFFRYFREGLQTIEHFGSYIEDLLNKMSIIRQNQFEEKRDLEEVRNVLKTSPGFNKMVIFYLNFHQKIMYYFQPWEFWHNFYYQFFAKMMIFQNSPQNDDFSKFGQNWWFFSSNFLKQYQVFAEDATLNPTLRGLKNIGDHMSMIRPSRAKSMIYGLDNPYIDGLDEVKKKFICSCWAFFGIAFFFCFVHNIVCLNSYNIIHNSIKYLA